MRDGVRVPVDERDDVRVCVSDLVEDGMTLLLLLGDASSWRGSAAAGHDTAAPMARA